MDWSKTNKKKFRQALQGVYRTYGDLRIFAAEELDWRLEEIVPSSHNIKVASFELIAWAEGRGKLQALCEAFREEHPDHPFFTQVGLTSEGGAEIRETTSQINQDHQSSGNHVVDHMPPKTSPAQPLAPDLGNSFAVCKSIKTASITSDGVITERQKQIQCQVFPLGGTPLEMVWIPAGSFLMGSPESEPNRRENEGPQHRVTFAEGFWMGRYPVTQAQWRWIACLEPLNQSLKANPSGFPGDKNPVEQVSWDEAQEFCCRLSREFSQKFKLPSEAQWEYACRAGTKTAFAFGNELIETLANYTPRSSRLDGVTTEVGQFPTNGWGLHDMHGNVWEWCEDTPYASFKDIPSDGTAWINSALAGRMLRGGSCSNLQEECRSASRRFSSRHNRHNYVGFRVVCSPD